VLIQKSGFSFKVIFFKKGISGDVETKETITIFNLNYFAAK